MGLAMMLPALPPPSVLVPGAAGLGLILGSFLSALTWRLPRGDSVAKGRSACPACRHPLAPRDLVPVASWLLAGGRCRYCGAAVSPRYPLIETACAITCAVVAWRAAPLGWGMAEATAGLALAWCLLALAVVDLEHGLLPDRLTVLAAVPALALRGLETGAAGLATGIVGGLVGVAGAWLLRAGFHRLTGREGLGLGDVKVLFVAGVLLTPGQWPPFLLLAGLGGVGMGLLWRGLGRGAAFPFGPALLLALAAEVLFPGLAVRPG
jgi:leader peptidase (prepilin peptidase)/N-methyltransferase